ncbi:MAG: aminoglycoside phosphotransferase family protein [Elusimicrobiota bacterium]
MIGSLEAADLQEVARRFRVGGEFLGARPCESGHIHDTFVIDMRTKAGDRRYVLQRINNGVFRDVQGLQSNIEKITRHIRNKTVAGGDGRRRCLSLVPTIDERTFHRDAEGAYWRVFDFIEGARTHDLLDDPRLVYNAAHAFGGFLRLMGDFPSDELAITIPHFHDARHRFERFRAALGEDRASRAGSARGEADFILARKDDAGRLLDLMDAGALPRRVTHNDTKLNNVMIDDRTGEGLCVIDLDTVMPGLTGYDFGDAVRLGASTAAEDERDLSRVRLGLGMFDRLAHGYLDATRGLIAAEEVDELAFACKLMCLVTGVRFLTDHLEGDVYFKVRVPDHNLARCRTQLKMVSEIESKMDAMREIIDRYR